MKCTWDALTGKGDEQADIIRKNPRKVWYANLEEVTVGSDTEVTFKLGTAAAVVPVDAGGRLLAGLCLPRASGRDMRSKPIGTGPFKVADFKRNESIKLVRNPDYWKKGRPYLDAIDWKIVPNRSTRMLGFVAGEFDMTFDSDVTFPLLEDVKAQKADAVCEARPTNVNANILINSRRAAVRQSGAAPRPGAGARPRSRSTTSCSRATHSIGAAMLPPPAGFWGMPKEMLPTLAGLRHRRREEPRRGAQDHGEAGLRAKDKPLKIKVSTRNIAIYRDPAVILIDQLKSIYIDGELDPIDTTRLVHQGPAQGLHGGHEPDRRRRRRSGRQLLRELLLDVGPQLHGLQESRSRQADRPAVGGDAIARSARSWCGRSRRSSPRTARVPIISHNVANTCWTPQVKGLVLHAQQHLQRLALRGRAGSTAKPGPRPAARARKGNQRWGPI